MRVALPNGGERMTEPEARARLELMLDLSGEPILSASEFEDVFQQTKIADVDGSVTYDLNRAAVIGWLRKAAKAVSSYNFTSASRGFSRAQIFDHCLAMAKEFKRRSFGSARVGSTRVVTGSTLPVGNAWAQPPEPRPGLYIEATDPSDPRMTPYDYDTSDWRYGFVVPY